MTDADETAAPALGRYYRGVIKKLFVGSGTGVVLSDTGREIPFIAPHVLLTGEVERFANLREGMRIGFDVGWTSRGLRVTLIHTGPDMRDAPSGAS
jgi:hypothetical protein